jgi:hypothetical protein
MKIVKVEDNTNLVRDIETGAILFNNPNQYDKYINQRKKILSKNQQMEQQAEVINSMQDDILEIKTMLTALINRNK